MPHLEDEDFSRSVVYLCEHSAKGALGLVINKPIGINMQALFGKVDLTLRRTDLSDQPVLQGGPLQLERGFVLHEPMRAVNVDMGVDAGVQVDELGVGSDVSTKLDDTKPTADALNDAAQPDSEAPIGEGLAELNAVLKAFVNELADDESAYASTIHIPGGLDMTTSKDVLEALSHGAGPSRVLITLGYSSWDEGQLEAELSKNAWLTVGADLSVIFDTPVTQRYDRALALLGIESWMISPEAGHA